MKSDVKLFKVKDLKEYIKDLPDDLEVFIKNVHNPCGNISELGQIEHDYYGFFGESIPCLILNSHLLVQDEDNK